LQGLTAEDIEDRIYASKVAMIVEQNMILVQWGCKSCLILIYYRLT
jgi:hypothetical protein